MSKVLSNVRHGLPMVGLGTAGTAAVSVGTADKVFAKQFVTDVPRVTAPEMLYDANLQMMVDPTTRSPLYNDPTKLDDPLPTVTAGCSDCPKRDD